MSFPRYLSRLGRSRQGNRTARRAKKNQQPRLTFFRPYLEYLEDRIAPTVGTDLSALQGAAGTVGNFASSLQSGPLNQPLPIVSGGTSTLGQILGLSAPFQAISSALNNIDPTKTNLSDLQNELGPGFTVTDFNNGNDGIIAVTYSQNVSSAAPSLSVATNPTDFFGGSSNNYFSKIVNLSGSATGQFSPDTTFSLSFGADGNGFFVGPSTVFSSNDFKASLNLNGTVNIGQSVFSVGLSGTGTIDLQNINLKINQQVSGSSLSNIGQAASFQVGSGSNASVTGDFKASVLGAQLVEWSPTISWGFGGNGALQAAQLSVPSSGAGAPSLLQGGENSVETAMLNTLTDALGLSQFNVLLDPLAQVPGGLQDIINFITSLTQSNVDDSQLDPTSGLDQLVSGNDNGQNPSFFQLGTPQDLLDFAEGKPGATLITFATPKPLQFLNIPIDVSIPSVPIVSFLGLINLTLGGQLNLTFGGSASISVGVDSSGLFVNTDPTQTNITFDAQAGAGIQVALNVAGIIQPGSVTVGPQFETKAILELQPATNSKLYLSTLVSNLDQSGGLSGLGSWLSKELQLEVDLDGNIKLDLQVNTPVGGLIQGLPGPVGDLLKPFAGAVQDFIDFLSGAVEDVCNGVNDVSSFLGFGDVLNCKTVKKVAEITFGQYLDILDPFFESLGAQSVHSNGGQTADYIWLFPIFDASRIFKGDQISSGQGNSSGDTANQSDPSDFIGYQVSGSTLTITGAAGTDNIQVKDLGNGQIQLLRSGIDGSGNAHTDPTRNFSGITQINATMNDSSGTNDSFVMDSSLNINTTVTGGAGNERIVTGAGDDTINAGDGNDDLEGGNGTNHINAGNGHDTLVGGSGTDFMKGGSGGDLFQAGSGTETMTGGSGDDTFVAGSGTDVAHGGGGNDTFQGGSGNATFYGEGGANDSDTFFGGSGSVTAYGSAASSNYFAGSGTMTVHGGPGQDSVYWQDGDGNVNIVDGGGAPTGLPDTLQATGGAGSDTFTATANGTGISVAVPGATLTASNIQELNLDGAGGADNITVHDLSGTSLQFVAVNFGEIGSPDHALDTTTLYGPANTTVNISETNGTASLVQPPVPGQEVQVTTVSGPVMQITGLGPTVVVPDDEDAVNVNPGGSNTVNINTQTMHGSLTVNGGSGVNTFNVQAVSGPTTINTTGGQNTMNVGSKAPGTNGVLSGIAAALTLNGSGGTDTVNVDDTGDMSPQSGTLTPTSLTGLGMGPSGITYSNLAALNISLGSGGNSFTINVPSGTNLPATTMVNGGTSNNDSLTANYALDMNGSLILTQFEQSTIQIGQDLNGYLSDTAPGSVQLLSIGRSLTSTGKVVAGSLTTLTVGQDLAGSLHDLGDLGTATIGNNLSGSMTVDGNATSISVGANLSGQVTVGQALSYLTVGQNLSGSVSETGTMQQVTIGGSLTNTGILSAVNTGNPAAGNIVAMTIGPNQLSPGHDMAGQIIVSGTLTLLRVADGTPGTIVAGHVGQVLAYGGYGPVVLQIKENGVQRRVEAAVPSQPYPLPAPPPAAPAANDLPGVNFQYSYEGTSLGLANPQWTARITNANPTTDQYDVSLVVYSDTAKFNLARVDAAGVSGIRNVAVEGDLLTSVSAAAVNFLGGDNTPAGVRLPQDKLAAVAVRDNAPQGYVQAASIQGAAFGTITNPYGTVVTGPNAKATDAESLLASGTLIVQASDTFRVPFADALRVAFFMDTNDNTHHFSNNDVIFTDQSPNDARGAVTALISVSVPPTPPSFSTIQTIALQGDGGAIQTQQPIVQAITSTGPLGDLILTAAGGLPANVTASSIIGNISVQGAISGTMQTTGQRTDATTGITAAANADFGRLITDALGHVLGVTTLTAQSSGAIAGRLISRGNFLSQILANGGISGVLATQGNLGAQVGGVRYGGINTSNGPITGQVMVLGNVLGDIVAHGGLKGGRIAVQGSLLGNTVLDGGIDAASALVAGGSIGSIAAGTGLSAGNVQGILAANGDINLVGVTSTSGAAFYKADLSTTDPTSAAAVTAIFQPFAFDVTGLDLAGLGMMLQHLKSLTASGGEL